MSRRGVRWVQANSLLPSLRAKPCNRESAEAVPRLRLLASWACAGTSSISGKPNYRLVGIRRFPGLGPQGADERGGLSEARAGAGEAAKAVPPSIHPPIAAVAQPAEEEKHMKHNIVVSFVGTKKPTPSLNTEEHSEPKHHHWSGPARVVGLNFSG